MNRLGHISVIIPSYNSRQTICECLESVLNQSIKFPYEVIVVDSSIDGTDAFITRRYKSVKLIHINKKTLPGLARNIGAKAARSEYIAFTDSDCVVAYDWLENIMARVEKQTYDAVGGIIFNGTPESLPGTLGYMNEFSFFLPGTKSGFTKELATANVCYKSDLFNEYSFNETHFAGEDTIFHWAILERGGKLFLDPGIKVTHLNRKGFKNVLEHQRNIGEGAGIARMLMGKDLLLVQNPLLTLSVLPWLRLFRTYKRVFLCDKGLLKRVILFFPLSLIVSYSWCFGLFFSTLNGMFSRKKTW